LRFAPLYKDKIVNMENEEMYGYCSGSDSELTDDVILESNEEFEDLISRYPEHEVYLFAGNKIDMALFLAPGVSAMLLKTRASPDEIC
jgi:hypothetical protein